LRSWQNESLVAYGGGKRSQPLWSKVETAQTIKPNSDDSHGIIGHGHGPSGGEPRYLGILEARCICFGSGDRSSHVAPDAANNRRCNAIGALSRNCRNPIHLQPAQLQIHDWKLPDTLMPIDLGCPA